MLCTQKWGQMTTWIYWMKKIYATLDGNTWCEQGRSLDVMTPPHRSTEKILFKSAHFDMTNNHLGHIITANRWNWTQTLKVSWLWIHVRCVLVSGFVSWFLVFDFHVFVTCLVSYVLIFHALMCPLTVSYVLPSVCVFRLCFPFTPCPVIVCICLPLLMLTFMLLVLFLSCPSSLPMVCVLWILILPFLIWTLLLICTLSFCLHFV